MDTQPSARADTWVHAPAPGVRLRLSEVLARIEVSGRDIQDRLLVTKNQLKCLAATNLWPLRVSHDRFKAELCNLLAQRGATPEELATLFCTRHKATTAPRPARVARARAQPTKSEAPVLLPKQTLTLLAKKHFKLFVNPFEGPVERDEQFFVGDEIQLVRDAIWQCAQNSGFMALIGESGAGKTTLKDDLADRLAKDARGATMIEPGVLGMEATESAGRMLKTGDILHAVINTLSPSATVPNSMQARTLLARKLLGTSARAGENHVLVVEEAHGMPDPTLKHLKRLHELRQGRRSLLGVLLLGQPELKTRLVDGLRNGGLREVAQRCEVVELGPLGHDLGAYLEHRSRACGKPLGELIEPDAVDELRARLTFKTPAGDANLTYPLAAGNAVTRAMNLAAEVGAPLVTAEVMRAI